MTSLQLSNLALTPSCGAHFDSSSVVAPSAQMLKLKRPLALRAQVALSFIATWL